ncbi:hypothetical protein ACWD0G_27950, partial [Streptomyces goshikiensis]
MRSWYSCRPRCHGPDAIPSVGLRVFELALAEQLDLRIDEIERCAQIEDVVQHEPESAEAVTLRPRARPP